MSDLPASTTVMARPAGLRALALPDGGLTIYSAQDSAAFIMNASAAQVWNRIDGRTSIHGVVHQLEAEHGELDSLAADVAQIIADLHGAGLVVPVKPPG